MKLLRKYLIITVDYYLKCFTNVDYPLHSRGFDSCLPCSREYDTINPLAHAKSFADK